MKCIAVTSGKGGTGKSCIAAYTGAALTRAGRKVLLVELGGDARSLDLILGVQEQAVFDVTDVLAGRCEPGKAIIRAPNTGGLTLLPAGLAPPEPDVAARLPELLRSLRATYDYVILDGVDYAFVPPAYPDITLQVLTPDSLCLRACAGQARFLFEAGVRAPRLIINNVPSKVLPIFGAGDFDDIIDTIGIRLIAVLPASPKLQYAANNGEQLDEESLTVKIFDNLAGRLLGKRLPLLIR